MEVLSGLGHALGWIVLGGAIVFAVIALVGGLILACQKDLW